MYRYVSIDRPLDGGGLDVSVNKGWADNPSEDSLTVLALIYAPPLGILSGASRPRTPARGVSPVGYLPKFQNFIIQYFEYQLRILRGRFTPGGFLPK